MRCDVVDDRGSYVPVVACAMDAKGMTAEMAHPGSTPPAIVASLS